MKKLSFLLVVAMLFIAAVASANPFSDVPFSHWSYDAVNKLAAKGILQGYPDGTFKGHKAVTRYALAMVVAKMLANVEQMMESGVGTNFVTKSDLQTLEKLTTEFADELALLGVKVTALEDDMQITKEDVSILKRDVAGIKDYIAKGGMEKVKLSGDMLVRHSNLNHRNDWVANPLNGTTRPGNSNNVLTESQIRIRFTANIDENVSAVARWRMFVKNADNINNGAASGRGGAFGSAGIGGLTTTDNVIDTAYLRIKDMFRFGGDFTFGRKWRTAGHALLVNAYTDAIVYNKRVGDVDLTLQSIFDRHTGNYKDDAAVDFRPVWNLNLASKYKEHNVYLDFYMQDEPNQTANIQVRGYTPIALRNKVSALAVAGTQTSDSRWDIEFGSKGPLSNNGHWDYDLGFVYTNYDLDIYNPANTMISPEMQGWIGHAAVKWDSKKQWAAKLAYTFADDESVGAYSLVNDARYSISSETPYEDISRGNRWFNNGLLNMYDAKVQFEYRPRDSKHYFRLAGDWLDEMNDTVSNDLAKYAAGDGATAVAAARIGKNNTAYDKWNNLGIADPKAFVLTFEYIYQLAANTRLRVGYTQFDFSGDATKAGWTANGVANAAVPGVTAGRGLNNDYDYKMFWTEIYSKF